MTLVWGVLLGAGLLLVVSPRLWPRRPVAPGLERTSRIAALLAEAGFGQAPPAALPLASIGALALAAAIAWIVTTVPALAALAGVFAALLPTLWLRSRAHRRRRSHRAMWPDVCDLLISAVRSGMTLPDAIASLGTTGPEALRDAFRRFGRDVDASGHVESALDRLKEALADPVADRIVESLRMARQVGGTQLTSVLRSLGDAVRADTILRAEVESRQSWTRGAAILGVAAPWAIVALLAMRPEGAEAYSRPEGVALLVSGAVVSFVAFRVMLRIGRLPESKRWFA